MKKGENELDTNKSLNIKNKLTSMFELPKEIVLNLPLISITGKQEINIENYKGIIEYSEQRIRINTSCGILKIEGLQMTLKLITDESITIIGTINRVEYVI